MSTFTEAQREAISASGNVLVSAGAGTGKTRTVVERCLRLIEEGCSLENILMVTFTEAAAAEMRSRLRTELERSRDPSRESPSDRAGSRMARPSAVIIEEQLALLDTANISTLHSFCLDLIRDHFHVLHIDPQVNVLDDAQAVPLIHQTLDALLDRCYGGSIQFADAIKKIVRQHGGSDDKLRALVLKVHRYTQSLPPSERWLERELARIEMPEPTHWPEWLGQGVIEWRDEWMPELKALANSPHVARCLDALSRLRVQSSLADIAESMRCIVAAEEEKWSRRYPKKEFRDPIQGFFKDARFLLSLAEPREGRDALMEDWQWMHEPVRALLLLTREFTTEFARAKRTQGGVDFADLEQLALELLVDERGEPTEIARAWQRRLEHVFVDECQDINAAQDAIIRAVSREPGRGRVTGNAPEQPDLLELTESGSIARTGNRFLVGDVKQSIYRFRLADPGIFRRCEDQWRERRGGQRITLADNFRSREAILHFINPLFAALMRPTIGGVHYDNDAQLRFGAPNERAQLSVSAKPGPRVELHVISKVSDGDATDIGEENGAPADDENSGGTPAEDLLGIEKEARLVARLLRQFKSERHEIWDDEHKIMRPAEWRDMVVLLRSPAARVETFAKEFSRAGIPLAAARAGFYSAIEVQDLVNLLRLLDNPLQDIPLAAVLRSPLVALSPNELAATRALGASKDRHASFASVVNHFYYHFSAAHIPAALQRFAESAHGKLQTYCESFNRWRSLVRQTSVSHALEKVLAETHYEALLLAQPRGRERVANVQRLLELARFYDPFQRQGLFRFLRFIDEQQDAGMDEDAATVEVTNAVRLMSIHRSKGLEFPIVVVAGLAGQFNAQDLRDDILLNNEFGLCAKIVPPHIERRYPSLPWWLAKRRESRELLGEEMRLLYVAMTRARDTLVLTAFDKSKNAGVRWHRGPRDLDDRAVLKSQSYFGWVRRWLGANTNDANWSGDREGRMEWMRWKLYSETDTASMTGGQAPTSEDRRAEAPVGLNGECACTTRSYIGALRARLTRKYPFAPATEEPAKTNVSLLRRRVTEQDDEARQLFVQRRRVGRDVKLTAANIGSAHHLFMQRVEFDRIGSALDLRNQALRLANEGFLTAPEAAALDYGALLRFWFSDFGRRIVAQRESVHRELPFTARFRIGDLGKLGFSDRKIDEDEFVIVQGVVDLALITKDWIEIVDFKTDQLGRGEARTKADAYRTQLQLYAAALRSIYARPVRSAALHFLSTGETLPIFVGEI